MGGTIIVTGCSSGLGLHAVRDLLSRPGASSYHYIFAVRSHKSTSTTPLDDLVSKFNAQHDKSTTTSTTHATIKSVELGDLNSIRAFTSDINHQVSSGKLPTIRALLLNAGLSQRAQKGPQPATPQSDIEIHFQVNYLANLTLSLLLLQSVDKTAGRIVYVSSWAHDSSFYINAAHKPEAILWKDDECERVSRVSKWPTEKPDEIGYGGGRRYGASKFWLVMGMLALQQRLEKDPELSDIAVVGVDPGGNLQTNIARGGYYADRAVMYILGWYVILFAQYVWPNGLWRTETKTAADIVNAGLVERPAGMNPKGLYLNGSEVGVIAPEAKEESKQDKLWKASLKLANIKQQETLLKI